MPRVRTGSYRQSFFTPVEMEALAARLWPRLEEAKARAAAGHWSPAEFAGFILTLVWSEARPRSWTNGPRPRLGDEQELPPGSPLATIQKTRLRGIPPEAADILIGWHRGRYPLDLVQRVPSALEVLEAQCRGRRCVSVLVKDPEAFIRGGEGRDSFSFTLHDLLHAWHFYRDPEQRDRQVFFSKWMREFLFEEEVRAACADSSDLRVALEYLSADMNTHWVHAVKCLKSILRTRPRLTELGLVALERLPGAGAPDEFRDLWDRINSPDETPATRERLHRWLDQFSRHSSL